ncbi:MAG: nuclear transport factor 2 family protein [Chloroflexota bacterium]|nr:nuclear transport factor 2 family protein [Chloroflexota bacterium]
MTAWRLSYVGALERSDTAAILDALADDVVIHVAVHDQPMRGKEIAGFLFGVLAEELGAVTVTDEIVEGDNAVVVFETSIGERTAQGLNVVRLDEAGVIRELTVFFRPLAALTLIAEVVGGRMAERFGPPPQ